jgi:hypothetical protein
MQINSEIAQAKLEFMNKKKIESPMIIKVSENASYK